MLQRVRIVHSLPGRTRLRLLDIAPQPQRLFDLKRRIGSAEGVLDVIANPRTSSLLIRHEQSLETLLENRELAGAMSIVDAPHLDTPIAKAAQRPLRLVARAMPRLSGGQLNPSTVAGLALLIFSLSQFRNGQVFPPAASMVWAGLRFLHATQPFESFGADDSGSWSADQ